MTKRVLVMGDFHVGDRCGLNMPEYLSQADKETSDCLQLYERFLIVRDWAGKVNIVVLGGDLADGWNLKEHGDRRVSDEPRQVEIAVKLAKLIKGSPKFYAVDGSPYHRGTRNLDTMIADKLGAVEHPHYHTTAPPLWDFRVEKVQFNDAHPISISKSTWQYMTTPIAREEVLAILNNNGADIVLRHHAHYFVYAGYTHHFGAVCPGFQTKTPFQGRVSPLGEYKIGALLFLIDDDEFDWYQKIWSTKAEVVQA